MWKCALRHAGWRTFSFTPASCCKSNRRSLHI
uniref:Uncharacterized protein n=1 Tax=Anguilla anguilla TaxID=7936 RepID=A0A0E9Q243_ANGAN